MTDSPFPPAFGSEREMLIAFVNMQRDALLWKIEDLSDEQLRAAHVPSGMSMLGLFKHLAFVEETWFQGRLAGVRPTVDPNDDSVWNPGEDETPGSIRERYDAARTRSDEIALTYALDRMTAIPSKTYGSVSLQWILFHMIEEYARHLGHADFIREAIDGAVGVSPAYEHLRRLQKLAEEGASNGK